MGLDGPGGAGGGNVVGQGVGGAGEDVGLHRGRKEGVADALAEIAQALVGAGLAHGEADDRTDHGAEQEAAQAAGRDRDAGGRNHGSGGDGRDRDVGRHFQHTAEDVGHHRGVIQRIAQASGPERVRHASRSSDRPVEH